MIDTTRVTGLILAGGRGARMGSVDKGLQPLHGRPLIAHAIERLVPQVGSILISANRNADRYALFGHRVLADLVDGYAGPMAGLHAGLRACTTEFLVSVPCDAPHFPLDLVAHLGEPFDDPTIDVTVACTPQHVHPVFCMMRTTVLADVVAYLDRRGRGVGAWINTTRSREVSFAHEALFRNLNTIDELRDAESEPSSFRQDER